MIEIDRILEKCGDFHRYQYILLGLFCLINVLSSMHYYSQTIISFVPQHWCFHKNIANGSVEEIRQFYAGHKDAHCVSLMGDDLQVENGTCNHWIYDLDHGYQSMTSEFDWVCTSAWKSTLGQSMFFVGSVVGSLLFGVAADVIGRLPVLILSNVTAMIGNIATIFTTGVVTFSICRFISGMATDTNFVMMYILVMEYIRPSMRTIGLNLCIGAFYCIGCVITPWIAVGVGNWQMFLLATSTPLMLVPCFYFFVPESAQWLITQKKYDDAINCFRRVASVNGRVIEDSVFKEFQSHCTKALAQQTSASNMCHLFKTPRLRKNTLILLFKSMVITLCYDAISRNVEGLGLSPFLMFSISASAILPACLVLLALQDIIGRKAMASCSLLISGVFTSATGIIIAYQKSYQDPVLLAALGFIGRFGVSVAYNSGAQYATELIPTCVRGQGVALVHVAGYAFTFLSTYILFLSNIFKPLPSLILGTLSLIGAGLCLLLPETLNRTLPCTLEDGERFGKGESIFHFSCFERPKSISTATLSEVRPD